MIGPMQPRVDPGAPRTLGATAGVSAAASVLRAVAGFLAGIVVARALGPDGRGQFAFVTTAVALLVLVANLGVTNGLVQARAKRGRSIESLYGAAGWIGLLVGVGASGLFLLAYAILGDVLFSGTPRSAVLWVAVLVPPSLALQHWTAVGYIDSRVREFSVATLVGSVVFLVAVGLTAARRGLDLPTTVSLWGASALLPVALVVRGRRLRLTEEGRRAVREVLRFGLKVNFATLATVLTWRLDVLLVQGLRGSGELGYYAVAVSVAEGVLIVGMAARVTLIPAQSSGDRAGLEQLLVRVTRLMIAGALIVSFVSVLVARPLVMVLYGSAFAPAVTALAWLVPGIGALVVQGPIADFLLTESRIRPVTTAAVSALVINIAIDLILLPRIGFVAAAIGSTIAYLSSGLILIIVFRRHVGVGLRDVLLPRRHDLTVFREAG